MNYQNLFYQQLEEHSGADYVKVVRCENCNNWDTEWDTAHDGYHYCPMIDLVTSADFYCAKGERKDG